MCAGLKKCAPMTRSWDLVLAPMSSMSMVEVLVDRMQSGPHTLSRSAGSGSSVMSALGAMIANHAPHRLGCDSCACIQHANFMLPRLICLCISNFQRDPRGTQGGRSKRHSHNQLTTDLSLVMLLGMN